MDEERGTSISQNKNEKKNTAYSNPLRRLALRKSLGIEQLVGIVGPGSDQNPRIENLRSRAIGLMIIKKKKKGISKAWKNSPLGLYAASSSRAMLAR